MIDTSSLFRPLSMELTSLLRGLDQAAWSCPTSASEWSVKDVVAHLLDGDLRRLSAQRDGHLQPPSRPIPTNADLVAFLNHLNRTWIEAARRLSPRVLTELLDSSSQRVAELFEGADGSAPATFSVAWAGEASSPMWLDVAREYTERWHHQDQIREAVGAAPLAGRRWLRPVLETSLFALPHAYRDVSARDGAVVLLRVEGEAGGEWALLKQGPRWTLVSDRPREPACTITASDLVLCRLLLHRLKPAEAECLVYSEGDKALGAAMLNARAVMV